MHLVRVAGNGTGPFRGAYIAEVQVFKGLDMKAKPGPDRLQRNKLERITNEQSDRSYPCCWHQSAAEMDVRLDGGSFFVAIHAAPFVWPGGQQN